MIAWLPRRDREKSLAGDVQQSKFVEDRFPRVHRNLERRVIVKGDRIVPLENMRTFESLVKSGHEERSGLYPYSLEGLEWLDNKDAEEVSGIYTLHEMRSFLSDQVV